MAAVEAPENPNQEEKERWGSRAEYILSVVGSCIGLGNIWRFPYLAYKYGGSTFLIPYIILQLLVGRPIFFLESAMGQFTGSSSYGVFECCPLFQGVAISALLTVGFIGLFYNLIQSYSLMYLVHSFKGIFGPLPWTTCGNESQLLKTTTICDESKENFTGHMRRCYPNHGVTDNCSNSLSPSEYYLDNIILNRVEMLTDNLDLGQFVPHIVIFMGISWLIVNLFVIKGIKTSGKVVYFTATMPYIFLTLLLIKGLTLPGAKNGLHYLFMPKWSKLWHLEAWYTAASQLFFSLGIAQGTLITLASYNDFHSKVNVDVTIVTTVDLLTSLLGSCVIFSFVGFLAHELGVDISEVAAKDQGLAFIVYPQTLAKLPGSWIWAVMFFGMLFLLSIDSLMAFIESILMTINDIFPITKPYKTVGTIALCSLGFLFALPGATQGGKFWLDLIEGNVVTLPLLLISLIEVITFAWVYGTENVCQDIEQMIGFKPAVIWRFCWSVISPLTLIMIMASELVKTKYPQFDGIDYPEWAATIMLLTIIFIIFPVPVFAVWHIFNHVHLQKKSWKTLTHPSDKWANVRGSKLQKTDLGDQEGLLKRYEDVQVNTYGT